MEPWRALVHGIGDCVDGGLNGVGIHAEREVEARGGTAVVWAHPQSVGCDGADLGHQEHVVERARPIERIAAMARTESARSTKNSAWISSPELGVESARKCGSRSHHGPERPSCSVQASAAAPGIGWRGPSAGDSEPRSNESGVGSSVRCLHHSLSDRITPACEHTHAVRSGQDRIELVGQRLPIQSVVHRLGHVVVRLGLQHDTSDQAECAEVDDHAVEVRVALIERRHVTGREEQIDDRTAVARLPSCEPDPCVPVAIAPPTEMCGSEARLCSARP